MSRVHDTTVVTIVLLILLESAFTLQASEPGSKLPPKVINFEHLTTKDGLSSPVVMGVVQDEQGFMWFGTTNGISRFDGYTFTNYPANPDDPNDPTTVGAAVVTNLLIDSEGLFWIATYGGGVDRYDAATDRFIHYRHNPDDPDSIAHNIIQTMSEDSQGNLWFATIGGGLNRYDREQDRFIHYRHNPDDPQSIADDKTYNVYEDSQGILWVAVAHGIDRFDREHNRFIHYRHNPDDPHSLSSSLRWTIVEDHLGTLWLNGMDGGGLVRYDREEDHFIRYMYDPDDPHSLSADGLRNSFEDSKGTLWVATMGGGVNVYDRENDRFIRYQHDPSNPHSIIYDDIIKVYEDRSGVLWFSTFGGGISKYDRKTERFQHIRHDPADPNSLSDTDVHAIFQDSRGDFWIGTTGGLNKYDPQTETFTHYRQEADNTDSLSGNFVKRVTEDAAGFLWIATLSQGLNKYDPHTGRFTHYKHAPDNPNSLAENACYSVFYDDGNHELWIGQQSHVSKYAILTETFTHYETTSFIEAIHKDRSGNMWLGGGAGLFTYNREKDTLERMLDRPSVALGEDSSGNLWVGTVHGLSTFDRDTEEFIGYSIEDGLIDNSVMGILDDGAGGLWISTGKGLSHFNINNETFRNYDVGAFNRGGAYYKSTSGELLFGGPHGIIRFFHDDIVDNPHTPPIVLTSFSKFNKDVELETPVSSLKHLELTYQDRGFSLEFAALDYSDPARNRYKYTLEGFDTDWVEVGSERRMANYTNLDGGDYIFRVLGSNNDGIWNEEGLALNIHIAPPWWETWWFYTILALSSLLLLLSIIFYISKLHFEISERKQATEALREANEFAKNLVISMQDGFSILDTQGVHIDVNPALCRMTGFSREELLGVGPPHPYWPPESFEQINQAFQKTLQRDFQNFELVFMRKSGERFPVIINPSQIEDAQGKVISYVSTVKNITDRKQAEDEIRELNAGLEDRVKQRTAELETANKELKDFAYVVSHDLKAPLRAISRLAQWLVMDYTEAFDEHGKEMIDLLVGRVKRMDNLIEGILQYSRIGRISKEAEPIELNSLVRDIIGSLSPPEHIHIHITNKLPVVTGDPVRLVQVFQNLISNAINFMDTAEGSIRIGCDETESYWQFHVRDNGPGIDPKYHKKIFQIFQILHPRDEHESTGIGLALVKKIIDLHGGRVWVESTVGNGSTFFFTLLKARRTQ